jgi:hypothetical protein
MFSRPFTVLLLAALLSFPAVWAARSQSLFERWVTPGELIDGHGKYEKDCAKCHESFDKGFQKQLCLGCHKDIAQDFSRKTGFHGKRGDVSSVECKHCHTDHKGRKADILLFDHQTFNHITTEFELKGAHKTLRCNQCHEPKPQEVRAKEIETDSPTGRYRKPKHECVDCHKKVEPHKTRLGDLCHNCHSEDTWKKTKPFDHDKTKFKLVDSHKKVDCVACHPQEQWKGVPLTCVGCHPLQDVHRGRYGEKCENCHEAKKWTTNHFDHSKTKFPLREGHKKVKCDACHPGDVYKDKLKTNCSSCHKKDDPHKGQLGDNCEKCHNEKGWRQKVFFDHDITRFPLIGRHATAPCEECHRTASYKGTTTKCADCHPDKRHEGRFGINCSMCHNPNGWDHWRFDHDKQTRFPLTGKHAKVNCNACHKEKHATKISLPTNCYGCHSGDDVHGGGYGRVCDQCHTTTSFKDVKVGR